MFHCKPDSVRTHDLLEIDANRFIAAHNLDEFPDSEAIRGFRGRDGSVLAHESGSLLNSWRHDKSGQSHRVYLLAANPLALTRFASLAEALAADHARIENGTRGEAIEFRRARRRIFENPDRRSQLACFRPKRLPPLGSPRNEPSIFDSGPGRRDELPPGGSQCQG
jgi:hypothetical protein